MNHLHLYEKKIINDNEFPVELFINSARKKGQYFPPHWHEHIELHYVLNGTSKITCNNKSYESSKGGLIIVNGNELHEGYCKSNELDCIVMIFEIGDFSKELANQNVIFQSLIEQDKVIQDLMLGIYNEYKENKIAYKLSSKGMVYQLIAYLMRNYVVASLSDSKNNIRTQNLIRLNKVLLYIEEHYTEPISNLELASLIHLSVDRFNHIFKDSIGMSPLKYINEVRIKKSKHLLKTGEYTVSEVAITVGFNDINHFGRMFKKKYGYTPSSIVKRI